jgi:hypothetical protein
LIVNLMFKGTYSGYDDTHLFVTFKSLCGKDVRGKFRWRAVQSLVISQDCESAFLDTIQRTTSLVRGWVRMRSQARPETFYFWNKDTGFSTTTPPPLSPGWLLCSYGQHLFNVNHNTGEVSASLSGWADDLPRSDNAESKSNRDRCDDFFMGLDQGADNEVCWNVAAIDRCTDADLTSGVRRTNADRPANSTQIWLAAVKNRSVGIDQLQDPGDLTSEVRRICVNMMKKSGEDVTEIDVSSMTRKILSNFETFHALPAGSATLEKVAGSSASLTGWAAYLPRSDDAESESKRLRIA